MFALGILFFGNSIYVYADDEPSRPEGTTCEVNGIEIDCGFEIKWATLTEAIEILEADKPKDQEGGYIQMRDLIFLKEALKNL